MMFSSWPATLVAARATLARSRGTSRLSGQSTTGSQSNLRRDGLSAAREEADLTWVGFHTFRHTCATMLFAQGRNAVQVQRWLGHHSPAFTLATYVHLLDGDLGGPLKPHAAALRPPMEAAIA